jgi:REP element-mobilizing transposase RayT
MNISGKTPDIKIWQPNYYDYIIRNNTQYQIISEYIINNLSKWIENKFNPANKQR